MNGDGKKLTGARERGRTIPYIKKYRRNAFDPLIRELASQVGSEGRLGEANYIITKFLLKVFNHRYAEFAQMLGTLEAVKLEIFRRVVAKYEDKKCELEGDVF